MDFSLVEYIGSPQFIEATSKWPKLVTKLRLTLENEQFYEAHQILKAIHFRLIPFQEKAKILADLLYKGACLLLQKNELVSGQDIATLFLEASAIRLSNIPPEEFLKRSSELNNPSLSYHSSSKTLDWEISTMVACIAVQLPDTEIGLKKFIADTLRILKKQLLSRIVLHEVLAKSLVTSDVFKLPKQDIVDDLD